MTRSRFRILCIILINLSLIIVFYSLSGSIFAKNQVLEKEADLRCSLDRILTFIDDSRDMWKLRELIGSIYRYNISTSITVYASLKDSDDYEEISTWLNVTVVNMSLQLFNRDRTEFKILNTCELITRIDHGSSDYVHIPIGLKFKATIDLCMLPSECNAHNSSGFVQKGMEIASKETTDTHRSNMNKCWLRHKREIVDIPEYIRTQISKYPIVDHEVLSHTWSGKRVALLIPTYNKNIDKICLSEILLPSLKSTLSHNELDKYLVTIYIGYDLDDPASKVSLAEYIPRKNVLIKMHRLPAIRWATAMWNMLYQDALRDGNDYFMQLGDDIQFNNPGWMTAMINELDKMSGVGMVGPMDTRWECGMMTQAMVTRKHFEIFGWFYPPEIKDWFSDNWLQTTYLNVKRSVCMKEYSVTNKSGLKERYEACDNVDLANDSLKRHFPKLSKYLTENRPNVAAK